MGKSRSPWTRVV